MDVNDREVGAPGGEQLQRVRGRARLADDQANAVLAVEALLHSGVDAGVYAVGREVECDRDAPRSRRPTAAACEHERRDSGEERHSRAHAADILGASKATGAATKLPRRQLVPQGR